jgi:RNA-dependent RNA polymerase
MPAMIHDGAQNWANDQERKVKIVNIPKGCWTEDVYEALEKFGNIVRIEIDFERSGAAWVTFRYVQPLYVSARC